MTDRGTAFPLWSDRWVWGAVAFFTGSGAVTIRVPEVVTRVIYGG